MVSLIGSRRHVGICVAVMMEKAVVVATAVIVASDEMVAEDVDWAFSYGESERKQGRVSESVDLSSQSVGLRVSAP